MLSSIRARVLATCVAIVAAALVGAMTNAAFKHILMVRDALTDVSSGSGDLTKRLPADGADEAAQIARAFNAFAEKIEAAPGSCRRPVRRWTKSSTACATSRA